MATFDPTQSKSTAPEAPATAPRSPGPAPTSPASRLATSNYADGKAALSPDAPKAPVDPATANYADGKAAVAPADPAAQEKKRQEAARQSYTSLLGEFLGGKLFDVVSKELSPDKIMAYGSQGLDAAAKAGVGAIKPIGGFQAMDEASEAEAVQKFAGALGDWAKGAAEAWLKTDDGKAFCAKISQWFEGHPGAVVAMALVAAAGAVAGNVALPELAQKFKLGDATTVDVGASLNKIRDIALKGAHLGVAYKKGDVDAALTYKFTKGEDGKADTHAISGKVGDATKSLTGEASVTGDVLVVKAGAEYKGQGFTAAAGVEHDQGGGKSTTVGDVHVKIGDDTQNVTADAKYDTATGDLSIGTGALRKIGDKTTVTAGMEGSRKGGVGAETATMGVAYADDKRKLDGSVSADSAGKDLKANVSGEQQLGGGSSVHGSLGYDSKDGASVGVGGTYQTPNDLKIQLDALLRQQGSSTVSASVESGDWHAKASAGFNLSDAKLTELAVQFGFQSKDKFEAFLVDYKRNYADGVPSDELGVMVETALGKLDLRGTSNTTFKGGQLRGNVTEILGAYPVGHDLSLIAGGKYGYEDKSMPGGLGDRDRGGWIEAGVQFKQVPIVIGYRPEDHAVSIGITIPFGR